MVAASAVVARVAAVVDSAAATVAVQVAAVVAMVADLAVVARRNETRSTLAREALVLAVKKGTPMGVPSDLGKKTNYARVYLLNQSMVRFQAMSACGLL